MRIVRDYERQSLSVAKSGLDQNLIQERYNLIVGSNYLHVLFYSSKLVCLVGAEPPSGLTANILTTRRNILAALLEICGFSLALDF